MLHRRISDEMVALHFLCSCVAMDNGDIALRLVWSMIMGCLSLDSSVTCGQFQHSWLD